MADLFSFDDAGVVGLLDLGTASESPGFLYAGSVIPSAINLSAVGVQYVYVGSKLFWPNSPIQLYTQLVAVSIFDTPGSYDIRVPSGITSVSIVAIGGGGGATGSTQTVAPTAGGDSLAFVNGTKVVHAGGGGAGSKSTTQTNSGGAVILGSGVAGKPGNLAPSQFEAGGGGGAGSFNTSVQTTTATSDQWNAQGGGGASILGLGTQQTGFGKGTAGIVGGENGQLGVGPINNVYQGGTGGLYGGGGGGARDGAEGGAGGGLAYVNNISVTGNDTISISVGAGGLGQVGGDRRGGPGARGAIAIYWGFNIPSEFPYLSSTYVNPLDYELYGESLYTTPGSYTWTCPTGVTSVSVVAVGGGGGAGYTAGGGGGLVWANNISVTPGNTYTIVAGAKGAGFGAGGNSTAFGLIAYGGGGGSASSSGAGRIAAGGTYFTNSYPDAGGGNGGSGGDPSDTGNWQGGGGAGGYTGNGGNGGTSGSPVGVNGSGGGGGGGYYGDNNGRGGAGGVGLYGIKENGVGGQSSAVHATGGSGGGGPRPNGSNQFIYGGNYGGGGAWTGGSEGGGGAVRIVWPGNVRKFPNINIGEIQL